MKAVIFDLDGTLLDTIEDLAICSNQVLEHFARPTLPTNTYKKLVGEGARALLEKILPDFNDTQINEARELFEHYYALGYDKNTRAYDGISKVLSFLQKRKIKMAILSNKPNNFTKKCAYKYLSAWNFDAVYGIREQIERKPDPAGALAIAQELHVEPSECYFVGDTKTDMQTATNAHMYPVGVLWGFRGAPELLEHGAQKLCERPEDIIRLFA